MSRWATMRNRPRMSRFQSMAVGMARSDRSFVDDLGNLVLANTDGEFRCGFRI